MRDYARNNILFDEVQFSNKDLCLAIEMAVSAFNTITPQTFLTPQSFPHHLRYLLLIGTSRFLMMSESFLQIRNQVSIQQGNVSPAQLFEKQAQYSALAQQLREEWDALARGVKTQNNMEGAYATLNSGYTDVSRFNR
jgi:hypothetical protein